MLSEREKPIPADPATVDPVSGDPATGDPAAGKSPGTAKAPPVEDPSDEGDEELASRALLSGLASVPPKDDLSKAVPDLIHRRSGGRFFGRKRLADRLPLEWISLTMLLLLALAYAFLKLLFTD